MKIHCTCDEVGRLPADIEPQLFDRNPSGLCEVCKEEPASEICTCGAWREFARAVDCVAVCPSCHRNLHVTAFQTFNELAESNTE